MYNISDNKIPVVSVVIGGGHGTIKTVHDAIKCGTPAVIIEGSGRAADILARAYKKSMEEYDDQSLQECVDGMVNEEFPKEKSNKSAVKLVMKCLQKKDHMNVLQLDSSDSAREIDELILQALRKADVVQVARAADTDAATYETKPTTITDSVKRQGNAKTPWFHNSIS
ncbi:Transient receptor potential cation channel subfamily M member 2 [Lamellibrachia satsuma]|nr:Transient receptor potential cation channel subfamily M member 2 [Lamellibrachia satsuma]